MCSSGSGGGGDPAWGRKSEITVCLGNRVNMRLDHLEVVGADGENVF